MGLDLRPQISRIARLERPAGFSIPHQFRNAPEAGTDHGFAQCEGLDDLPRVIFVPLGGNQHDFRILIPS